MQRILALLLLAAVWNPLAHGQRLSGRFLTSFYTWERFDTVGVSTHYLRGYEGLQIDFVQKDFSLHTYFQGMTNFGNAFGTDPSFRFYNLYVRWKNIGGVGEVQFGRVPFYAGAGSGTVDGAVGRLRVWHGKLQLTTYAGGNVQEQQKLKVHADVDKNFTWGGQLVARPIEDLSIGASYVNRRNEPVAYVALRPDSLFNPVPVVVSRTSRAEQLASGDARYQWRDRLTGYARYDYDMNLDRTYRSEVSLRVRVTDQVAATGDYLYRAPRIPFNSIFSVFTYGILREWEGGIEYTFTPSVHAFTRVAALRYSDTNSTRWTVGANARYASLSYSFSNGYSGELSGITAQAAYPLRSRTVIPTAAVSYARYKLSESQASSDEAVSGLVGVTFRPVRFFSFDLQGQWLRNSIVQNDLRLFGKITYWFSEPVNIF